MHYLLMIAMTSQIVPAGELSTNERVVEALVAAFPTSLETDRQGALQLFFLAAPDDSYAVYVSPPSPHEPSPPNVTVITTDVFDRRKSRLPEDAGVLADDGSLMLTNPRPKKKSGESVRYAANLGNDTVELLEKVWDAALTRAHTHYRTARPWLLFDGVVLCIRDDIPGHSDVIACVSNPTEGTTGARFYRLGSLLFRYAEAPPEQRPLLKRELRTAAEDTLKLLARTPPPPVVPER